MTVDPRRVAAAHALLAQLGVSVEDLQAAPPEVPAMPTVAQYLPRVQAAASPSSCRTYGTYWARMVEVWGDWPLDTVAATHVEALQRDCAAGALRRADGRGGRHAGENVISAARAFFTRAIADGLIADGASPAHQVSKPRRLPSHRRALTARELAEINTVARTSGNDVVLDALLLRLHTETACRRGGALGLRLMDLDVTQGWCGCGRKAKLFAGNRSPLTWPPGWRSTLPLAARCCPGISCCATATAAG
jgi:hypothetical protein